MDTLAYYNWLKYQSHIQLEWNVTFLYCTSIYYFFLTLQNFPFFTFRYLLSTFLNPKELSSHLSLTPYHQILILFFLRQATFSLNKLSLFFFTIFLMAFQFWKGAHCTQYDAIHLIKSKVVVIEYHDLRKIWSKICKKFKFWFFCAKFELWVNNM